MFERPHCTAPRGTALVALPVPRGELQRLGWVGLRAPRETPRGCLSLPLPLPSPFPPHRGVFHPDVGGLGFVGITRAPFIGTLELQVRLAAATFAGLLPPEDEAAQREGVARELRVRAQQPRPMLPHSDFVGHVDALTARLGVLPPPECARLTTTWLRRTLRPFRRRFAAFLINQAEEPRLGTRLGSA